MTPAYTPISLDHIKEYRALLTASGMRASDYSFGNIWGWAAHYGLTWRFDGKFCWLRQESPTPSFWAPVGDWRKADWASCPEFAKGMRFVRVPEELSQIWEQAFPGRVKITETRGQWDYLYKSEELANLPGNRFHKKKNLLNQFAKLYNHAYHDLTSDCVESVLDMQTEWFHWRELEDSASLLAENEAVARVLESWDEIPGLIGGVLRVEGQVVAYTVAEPVSIDTLVIHFEKGTPNYKGVYQAINALFARANDMYSWINREQDLDDEGLRKAKESYNPSAYIKKNTVEILPA